MGSWWCDHFSLALFSPIHPHNISSLAVSTQPYLGWGLGDPSWFSSVRSILHDTGQSWVCNLSTSHQPFILLYIHIFCHYCRQNQPVFGHHLNYTDMHQGNCNLIYINISINISKVFHQETWPKWKGPPNFPNWALCYMTDNVSQRVLCAMAITMLQYYKCSSQGLRERTIDDDTL